MIVRYWKFESWSYALSLLFLPSIYMIFGVFSKGDNIILWEFYFGIPYFVLGVLLIYCSFRWSAHLVAFLWFSHAFYDFFHNSIFVNTGVFTWYPYFCAAIDFVICVYILWIAQDLPDANINLA